MPHEELLSQEAKNCVRLCVHCYSTCTESIHYCLTEGGMHAEALHISRLLLCAETCQLAARSILLRASEQAEFCALTAKICQSCAEDSGAMDGEWMQSCAEACRRCAEACASMGRHLSAVA